MDKDKTKDQDKDKQSDDAAKMDTEKEKVQKPSQGS